MHRLSAGVRQVEDREAPMAETYAWRAPDAGTIGSPVRESIEARPKTSTLYFADDS